MTPNANMTPNADLPITLETVLNKMNINAEYLDKLPEERYDDMWDRIKSSYNLIEVELTALKDARCDYVFIADVPDCKEFKVRRRYNLLFCAGSKRR